LIRKKLEQRARHLTGIRTSFGHNREPRATAQAQLGGLKCVHGDCCARSEECRACQLSLQAVKVLQILEDQEITTPLPLKPILPDLDDLMVLEVAATTSNRVLVTGNTKHYPQKSRGSVLVLTTTETLSLHLK
jgi:hypothetical protein